MDAGALVCCHVGLARGRTGSDSPVAFARSVSRPMEYSRVRILLHRLARDLLASLPESASDQSKECIETDSVSVRYSS